MQLSGYYFAQGARPRGAPAAATTTSSTTCASTGRPPGGDDHALRGLLPVLHPHALQHRTYQLDRNELEAALLRAQPRRPALHLLLPATRLELELDPRRARRATDRRAARRRRRAHDGRGALGRRRHRPQPLAGEAARPRPPRARSATAPPSSGSTAWSTSSSSPTARRASSGSRTGTARLGPLAALARHQPLLRRGAAGSGSSRCTARPASAWSSTTASSTSRTSTRGEKLHRLGLRALPALRAATCRKRKLLGHYGLRGLRARLRADHQPTSAGRWPARPAASPTRSTARAATSSPSTTR